MRLSKRGLVFGLLTLVFASLTVNPQAFGQIATPTATPTPSETILWNLGNGSDGQNPSGSVIMDTQGNLYGTTHSGGAYGAGTVLKLIRPLNSGADWTESILWSFGNGTDAQYPLAGVIMDPSGNFYGTTVQGGAYGAGTVFKLTPPTTSGGNWTESILWNFDNNGTDGSFPNGGLTMDASGNLYGTTLYGGVYGSLSTGGGTVFELIPPTTSAGNWAESILWNFDNNGSDGYGPAASLIMDKSGNLYGTTVDGGVFEQEVEAPYVAGGTVFELTPPSTKGGNWTESILHSFGEANDGQYVVDGLIMDTSGNLYGATVAGGAYSGCSVIAITGCGTVFELSPQSTSAGIWTESILWNFGNGADGENPYFNLLMDPSGNLYGTTAYGGAYSSYDQALGIYLGGTAFKLGPPSTLGGDWTESILWNFGNGADGENPLSSLLMDTSGNLYGTTVDGGAYSNATDGGGTVFEITNIGASPSPTPSPAPTPTPTPSGSPTSTPATPTPTRTPTPIPTKLPTTMTLTSSPNESAYGESVTFTASVTSSAGAPPNGETILFESGTNRLGTAKLEAGKAVFTYTTLPQGSDSVSAIYGGDANLDPSRATTTQTVYAPADFRIFATCNIANSQNGLPPYPGSCSVTNRGPSEAHDVRVNSVTMNGGNCEWTAPIKNLFAGQSIGFAITCDNVITACNFQNTLTIKGTAVDASFSGTHTFLFCTGD
jgi:uncharacterized repeat protein (TIGR03803 family)